jgi:hypothetical protein
MCDYIIYKIQHCDNPDLLYIGSTTNLKRRIETHKHLSNTLNNRKLYRIINENGGWTKFQILTLQQLNCDKRHAEFIEDQMILELKATLNTNRSFRSIKQYYLDNREFLLKHNSIYRQNNIDKIQKKLQQNIKCSCGCNVSYRNISRHKRSNKHNYISTPLLED